MYGIEERFFSLKDSNTLREEINKELNGLTEAQFQSTLSSKKSNSIKM